MSSNASRGRHDKSALIGAIEEACLRSVGFSDVSNFRKAFRNWTGQSASHHRRGLPDAPVTTTHRRQRTSTTHPNLFDSHEHRTSTLRD